MSGIRLSASAVLTPRAFPYTAYSLADTAYVALGLTELTDKTLPFGGPGDYADEPNNAVLSPDGRWVAWNDNFPGLTNGEGRIRVISADSVETGAGLDVSADDPAGGWHIHPNWHPDNDHIVFVWGRDGFQGDIQVVQRTNPQNPTTIYTNPDVTGATGSGVYRPQYNRDGTKILWFQQKNAAPVGTANGLYVADADGSNLTLIDDFDDSGNGYLFQGDQACWGPDDTIYYIRYVGNGVTQQQLYKCNPDGTGRTQLSTDGSTSTQPCRVNARSFAPDDSFLIGTCRTGLDFANSWDVYRWELDGSGGTLLGTLAADGRSLGDVQNFRNVYVHADGRVYYVYGISQGQLASFLPDGSDWRLDVDLGVNMDGDQFYTGTGIQWI